MRDLFVLKKHIFMSGWMVFKVQVLLYVNIAFWHHFAIPVLKFLQVIARSLEFVEYQIPVVCISEGVYD